MARLPRKENREAATERRGRAWRRGRDESYAAQRDLIGGSPGIPSDWTEGPSHGSGAEGVADRWAVPYERLFKVCVNCSQ